MLWTIVSGIVILLGIVGTLLPFLPGPPLVLGGLLLYGVATDFANFSGWVIVIFVLLTIFTFFLDIFAPAVGARGSKASRYGSIGAIVGVIFGVVAFGPIGIVVGPLAGAFIGEYLASQNMPQAVQAARGALVAFLIGAAIKLGIVFAMAGYFIYLLFAGN